jgi:hypothetical protein
MTRQDLRGEEPRNNRYKRKNTRHRPVRARHQRPTSVQITQVVGVRVGMLGAITVQDPPSPGNTRTGLEILPRAKPPVRWRRHREQVVGNLRYFFFGRPTLELYLGLFQRAPQFEDL